MMGSYTLLEQLREGWSDEDDPWGDEASGSKTAVLHPTDNKKTSKTDQRKIARKGWEEDPGAAMDAIGDLEDIVTTDYEKGSSDQELEAALMKWFKASYDTICKALGLDY